MFLKLLEVFCILTIAMDNLKLPGRREAEELLAWGHEQNPAPWAEHSKTVARAAQTIASKCGVDEDTAYILGLLHDIGRYKGTMGLRHIYTGYNLMIEKGYDHQARICLSHSFPVKDYAAIYGNDCTKEEFEEIKIKIDAYEYDDYDRLIQLCDSICMAEGVCLLEVRLVDIARRYNEFNQAILNKWKVLFELKKYFDNKCGINIYSLFSEEIIKNSIK